MNTNPRKGKGKRMKYYAISDRARKEGEGEVQKGRVNRAGVLSRGTAKKKR